MEHTFSTPLISVIVPVYHVEQYLDRCVSSILEQTYDHLEVILIDDGSPDSCPRLCDEWAEKDPRVRVIHQENGGVSSARNAGLDAATGDYIAFVDSDDAIRPNYFETLYALLTEHQAELSICKMLVVDEEGKVMARFFLQRTHLSGLYTGREYLNENLHYTVWGILFPACVCEGRRFREDLVYAEDFMFLSRILADCERIIVTNKKLYKYTYRDDSALGKMKYEISEKKLANAVDIGIEIDGFFRSRDLPIPARELLIGTYTCLLRPIYLRQYFRDHNSRILNRQLWRLVKYTLRSKKAGAIPFFFVVLHGWFTRFCWNDLRRGWKWMVRRLKWWCAARGRRS